MVEGMEKGRCFQSRTEHKREIPALRLTVLTTLLNATLIFLSGVGVPPLCGLPECGCVRALHHAAAVVLRLPLLQSLGEREVHVCAVSGEAWLKYAHGEAPYGHHANWQPIA